MWGWHNCVREMVFRFTYVVLWKLHNQHRIIDIAVHVRDCIYSSVYVFLVHNKASSSQ